MQDRKSPPWESLAPRQRATLAVPVATRPDGSVIQLTALVVRGAAPGKTLLVTAGVHGDEFEGMAAIRRVIEALQPERLAGTFVGVPVANPPAYEAGLRTNPDDRQDLARVFPGDAGGTVTEQVAHTLTTGLIRHAAFYCDLHSAGQYYAMPALVGYQLRPEPMLSAQRAAARVFGLPIVWGTTGMPGRSLSAAAEAGVPAIYAEITGEGRCRPDDVERYLTGIRQLLAWMGMTGDAPVKCEPEWVIEDDRPEAGFLQVQNRAPVGGYFQPAVGVWERVEAEQRLGTICEPSGRVLHTAHAPHRGRVVFLRTFPRVLAGDPLCTILATES